MASVTLVPSGYTGLTNMAIDSDYPIDRAYTNAESTNYARFNLSVSTTGYVYLTFDTSSIPSGATITSVTARGKARVSNTSRVTGTVMQLFSGTTAKGSNRTFANTTASTQNITAGTWTRSDLNDLRLKVGGTGSSSAQAKRIDFYGADVTVTYTAPNVPATGVSLDKSTDSVEIGSTITLTETVAPADATNKAVSWSTSNPAVATVVNGVVTGVSAGTAVITVTTQDGGYTDTCTVTVTTPVYTLYKRTNTMVPGKSYLIANGDSGTVYLLSNESGGSRQLKGVEASANNGVIAITDATAAKTLFSCVQTIVGSAYSTGLSNNGQYIYCDNSNGLRMYAPSTLDRFWHFNANKFWQFKSSLSDGYSDKTSEYKYYLTLNNSNNYTDQHVTSTSIEDSTLPAMYLFEEYTPASKAYIKVNGTWTAASKVYKKVSGSWVEQSDLTNVFDAGTNYITA